MFGIDKCEEISHKQMINTYIIIYLYGTFEQSMTHFVDCRSIIKNWRLLEIYKSSFPFYISIFHI